MAIHSPLLDGLGLPLEGKLGNKYQSRASQSFLRFLDAEGYFTHAELGWLRGLASPPPDRKAFWLAVRACKKRPQVPTVSL